jgi:hypothetical protein
MARIWMSGFEAGSRDVFDSGTAVIATTKARTGSYAGYVKETYFQQGIMPRSELYIRLGLYMTGGSTRAATVNWGFLQALDSGGNAHLTFAVNRISQMLQVIRGTSTGTLLGSGSVVAANTWYCYEVRVVIDDVYGVVQVKRDGTLDIDLVGTEEAPLDTRNAGNGDIGTIRFGSHDVTNGLFGYLDDIAINDTTGTINNSWPGRGGIYPMIPSGAGTLTQFTPDSGGNYARVSDVPPDDDTSYVESAVLDTSDLYTTAGVTPTDGTVSAVQWLARARLTDSGAGNLRRLVRHDGVNYAGDDQGLDTSYRYVSEIMEEAPDETEWTLSKVNALEIGQQVG